MEWELDLVMVFWFSVIFISGLDRTISLVNYLNDFMIIKLINDANNFLGAFLIVEGIMWWCTLFLGLLLILVHLSQRPGLL